MSWIMTNWKNVSKMFFETFKVAKMILNWAEIDSVLEKQNNNGYTLILTASDYS